MSVTKIEAHHVAKAADRFLDFSEVERPSVEKRAAAKARIDAGEEAMAVFADLSENGGVPAAFELVKDGLGLSQDARSTLWEVCPELIAGLEVLDDVAALEVAAQIGAIVALTAQQLAAEDAAKGLSLHS